MKGFTAQVLTLSVAAFAVAAGKGDAGDRPPAAPLTSGKSPTTRPASAPVKIWAVVFDFECNDPSFGARLADSVRIRLRRHAQYGVIDRLTTQEFSGPVGLRADPTRIHRKMGLLASNVALCGTVTKTGPRVRAEVRCIDLRRPKAQTGWVKVFSDDTERARPVIALQIVETLRGEAEWVPPQYGDEAEPEKFGKPLNRNGDFEDGWKGWDAPDGVSTFLVKGPEARGTILRVRTDLQREPWLAYRRRLRLGRTLPGDPPRIERDTSYDSVAGLEGVHYRGEWIDARASQRYWMVADHNGQGGAKVFVKGFKSWLAEADGLPESSLAALGLTPEQFAGLPAEKRKRLIAEDTRKRPEQHRRECYRWYLNCASAKGQWKHLAAPFPPRGGLPKNVQWLQIQVYSYWPPGEYLWDDVHMYEDPTQAAPATEEPARTPGFDKR